jgi:hypothetical protein
MKFRKKAIVIEAVQWIGTQESYDEIMTLNSKSHQPRNIYWPQRGDYLVIETLEGDERASIHDWIIQGIKGETYPCKPDIFELTYEPVSD